MGARVSECVCGQTHWKAGVLGGLTPFLGPAFSRPSSAPSPMGGWFNSGSLRPIAVGLGRAFHKSVKNELSQETLSSSGMF